LIRRRNWGKVFRSFGIFGGLCLLVHGFSRNFQNSLDRIPWEFEISSINMPIGRPVTMKSLIRIEPKILSKVIPPFESKLGAGRLYLRWTTRQSQVQYFEKPAGVD